MLAKSAVTAIALTVAVNSADAAVVASLDEIGHDTVFSVSGSIDLTGATFLLVTTQSGTFLQPAGLFLSYGASSSYWQIDLSGPASFGPGGDFSVGSNATGGTFGLDFSGADLSGQGYLYLPDGYVSGAPLSASATFANLSLADMGVTPGTYTWTLANSDTITLNATAATTVIPLPAGIVLLGAGLAALGLRRCRADQGSEAPY